MKPKSHKVGRPTKKTEDAATIILRALENGATRRASAHIAGMTEPTFYEWVAQDAAFASAVEQAQAKFLQSAAKKIAGHAPSLLKYTAMIARNDPQLQPVQERVAVDLSGEVQVRWSEDNDSHASPAAPNSTDG